MEPSQYEERAQAVAKQIGIEVIAAYQGNQCPERGVDLKQAREGFVRMTRSRDRAIV